MATLGDLDSLVTIDSIAPAILGSGENKRPRDREAVVLLLDPFNPRIAAITDLS
jgi:hypothetical protein